MKYCKNCGKEVEVVGTNYCANCGATLSVSQDKTTKVLKLCEFGTMILAALLLTSSFTFDFFNREVEGKLGSGYMSFPWTTTRRYSMIGILSLSDNKLLVVMFSIMATILVLYCIFKLCFIFLNKNITVIKKVFCFYHIIFFILSILYAVLFAIFSIIIFNINGGLKPDSFFFLYAFSVLCVPFMDLAQLVQKKPLKAEDKTEKQDTTC